MVTVDGIPLISILMMDVDVTVAETLNFIVWMDVTEACQLIEVTVPVAVDVTLTVGSGAATVMVLLDAAVVKS